MSNFKFHLVTVVGIFLALALGIFIGSTFTEEGIIIQQRGAIEQMRADIDILHLEKRELLNQAEKMTGSIMLLQDWLGGLSEIYWQSNPVDGKIWLIEGGDFSPDNLSGYLTQVISTRITLEDLNPETIERLTDAIVNGNCGRLAWMDEGMKIEGSLASPDYVLIALNPSEYAEAARTLSGALVNAGIPVVALGFTGWEGLADLLNSPLYSSVSHLDTPLGLYCLGSIFQGQSGHYGIDNLLPAGVLGQ